MLTSNKTVKCDKCSVRIPKSRQNLICHMCREIKHYKCSFLSKNDVQDILRTPGYKWSCFECISGVLPIGICIPTNTSVPHNSSSTMKFKIMCYACNKMSYKKNNVDECPWCNNVCHNKCINGSLGCLRCCDKMIPGFRFYAFELLDVTTTTLNSKMFNPYDRNKLVNNIGDQIRSSEENSEFWDELSDKLIRCTYRSPKEIPRSRDDELGILCLNIRSIHKNLDQITDNITEYEKYDVISLNETNCNLSKLANGMDDLLIEGFHPPIFQAPARKSCRGGGLLTYVNKRVCNSSDDIESLTLHPEPSLSGEFLITKIRSCKKFSNTVLVVNIYRSPSSNSTKFIEIFDETLSKLRKHGKKQIILAGDFNIDLIKHERDEKSQNLIDTAASFGFAQVISRPTRITDHSATLIDHVYTNKVEKIISSNVVALDLSDHLGTYIRISLAPSFDRVSRPFEPKCLINDTQTNSNKQHEYRMFNEANNEIFKRLIHDESWEQLDGLCADARYEKFCEIYTHHYNTAYPLNTKRIRRKHERVNPKPWVTPWLEDAFNRKNLLYLNYVKEPSIQNSTKYDKMKKFCEKHKNIAKARYYKKYFDEHSDNSRKQWQLINSVLNRTNKKNGINKLVDQDGNVASSPTEIAEKFNNYFSSIAGDLKGTIENQDDDRSYEAFLNDPVPLSIFLRPVSYPEIYEIIKKLKNKSTKDTKISALKLAAEDVDFMKALTGTVSQSLKEGVFPQSLKVARVVPIHKSGSKSTVSNYRPISLLAAFSKIYEKVMHARLVEFLNKNTSIYDQQYGFRAGRSCEHALLDAQNTLVNSLHRRQISLLLLIDFSKAFDMVDHNILLHKLNHYGIRGIAHKWFTSYLSDRKQFVSINGTESSYKDMKYGVPQGSILGPLLFVIYINDLPGISSMARFILYADDANIIITGNTIYEIEDQLNLLSKSLVKWVDANGLLINLKKTNYIIFSRQNILNFPPVIINNVNILRLKEAKFLGVIIDEKLSWTSHIQALKGKMARYIGIMYKIKSYIPLQVRIQIYHSFIQSHLNYCSLVWGFSSRTNIECLFRQQKKGIRAVMPGFVNYFYKDGNLPTGTKSFFNNFSILTIHGIILSNSLIFMNKIFHFPNLMPPPVVKTIPENVPSRTFAVITETNHEWFNSYNTATYRNTVFFKGPLLFLDSSIDEVFNLVSCQSLKAFKSQCKRTILKLQRGSDDNDWSSSRFLIHEICGLRRSERNS